MYTFEKKKQNSPVYQQASLSPFAAVKDQKNKK